MSVGREQIAASLSRAMGQRVHAVGSSRSVMSGSASRMTMESGDLFVKWGTRSSAVRLRAEEAGLRALAAARSNAVPSVQVTDGEEPFILAMSWVDAGTESNTYWDDLAHLLADVHESRAERYGFDSHNFIGATPQSNSWSESWPAFFADERLSPQRRLAEKAGYWQVSWSAPFARLLNRIPELLPAQPIPALVHGDLWTGNVLVTSSGDPILIDPAVYFGHSEVDLAMAQLFGGFRNRFFDAYAERIAPESGVSERVAIYNLYHILNHVNLFGRGYSDRATAILNRF